MVNGEKGEVYRVGLDDGDAEPWETIGGTLYGASGGTTEGPTGTITCAQGQSQKECDEEVEKYLRQEEEKAETAESDPEPFVAPSRLPSDWSAAVVDRAARRLYFLGVVAGREGLYWDSLAGLGGGSVDTAGAPFDQPYGFAFDPSVGRFYWSNYGAESGVDAIGTASLNGGGGFGITVASAPVDHPRSLIVLKGPSVVSPPRVRASGATLWCSRGAWSGNYGRFSVYGAPERFAFRWSRNGRRIAGARGRTLRPRGAGAYTCAVRATNRFGSGVQPSAPYEVSGKVAAA